MKSLMKYILLLLSCAAFSVSAKDDFGSNISVELSKKLNKKIDISLEEEVRLNQNMGHFDRLASTLGADFKLIKKLILIIGHVNKDICFLMGSVGIKEGT